MNKTKSEEKKGKKEIQKQEEKERKKSGMICKKDINIGLLDITIVEKTIP